MAEQESKTIAGHVPVELAKAVEEHADREGVSTSRAVRNLLADGLEDKLWRRRVDAQQELLENPDAVGALAAVVNQHGETRAELHTRSPGYTGPDVPDVEEIEEGGIGVMNGIVERAGSDKAAELQLVYSAACAFADGAGMEFDDVLELLELYHEEFEGVSMTEIADFYEG